MNYLVTHYKNLAEQLQSRINNIQQCLYEMDTGSYTSSSRKDMGPVNPPTHGGGLLPPQNPNRRPEYAGRSAPKNPGHGGGLLPPQNTNRRPESAGRSARGNRTGGGFYDGTNELIRRPSSAGDSERPTTYDPNHEFWARRAGRTWLQNWNNLAEMMRSPNGISRSMREFLEQNGFEDLAAYRQFLINQALGQGVIPPPFPL